MEDKMRNFSVMIILACFMMIFVVNCSGGKTEMAWKNEAATVNDIAWLDSSDKEDKKWSGATATGTTTSAQEISALIGHGECLLGATPQKIIVQGNTGETFTVPEGSSNVYTIPASGGLVKK
jgi:hypothetical protein